MISPTPLMTPGSSASSVSPILIPSGRGIKETAADLYGRVGIRFGEFLDRKAMIDGLKRRFSNEQYSDFFNFEGIANSYAEAREYLAEFRVLEQAIQNNPKFAFKIAEGAQGVMLDVLSGPYPGTTSSSPIMLPHGYENRLGVMKFYDSSAGARNRAFVGAMSEELQNKVRNPQVQALFGEKYNSKR